MSLENPSQQKEESLFHKLGGKAAVNTAVDIFYEKVLADDRIKHFFQDVDMERQRGRQKAFLTFAFGGSPNYPGGNLRDAHRPLLKMGLNESHYVAVMENLGATLKELGVADELIAEVGKIADSVKDDVLCR